MVTLLFSCLQFTRLFFPPLQLHGSHTKVCSPSLCPGSKVTQPKVLQEEEEAKEEEEDRESGLGSTLDLSGSGGNYSRHIADRHSNALSRCEAGGQVEREGTAAPSGAVSPPGHTITEGKHERKRRMKRNKRSSYFLVTLDLRLRGPNPAAAAAYCFSKQTHKPRPTRPGGSCSAYPRSRCSWSCSSSSSAPWTL